MKAPKNNTSPSAVIGMTPEEVQEALKNKEDSYNIKDKSFEGFYLRFINISRFAYSIHSIDELHELKDRYTFLLSQLKENLCNFKISENSKGQFFSGYQLPLCVRGSWKDANTQDIYYRIREDIKQKIEYFVSTPERRSTLEKKPNGYYYDGEMIEMNETSQYAKFFDYLYLKSDGEGFLSYKNIMSGLEITKTQLNNALKNFFHLGKIKGQKIEDHINPRDLIKIERGVGLRLRK